MLIHIFFTPPPPPRNCNDSGQIHTQIREISFRVVSLSTLLLTRLGDGVMRDGKRREIFRGITRILMRPISSLSRHLEGAHLRKMGSAATVQKAGVLLEANRFFPCFEMHRALKNNLKSNGKALIIFK
ncbi:hypothetical protein CDAR_492931 [Caerostris darwini]|uniref:Uncharacterized protein n=1 Tax=Caerostris darwini TaxID=1538125 RepID=A0AAV4TAM6_9ARAC|nr:hypothetical protein CDAR_492931 [Caerostris darwini]